MFEKDSSTFDPGRDHERNTPEEFQDVRELQRIVKARGLKLKTTADESTTVDERSKFDAEPDRYTFGHIHMKTAPVANPYRTASNVPLSAVDHLRWYQIESGQAPNP